MWINCLAVGMGGFAGAVSRYLFGLLPGYYYLGFPVGTLLINLAGSFCIGFIASLIPLDFISAKGHLFLKTGFCGGFTTFSTFSLETVTLLEQGQWIMATNYVLLSSVLCIIGVMMGKMAAIQIFT